MVEDNDLAGEYATTDVIPPSTDTTRRENPPRQVTRPLVPTWLKLIIRLVALWLLFSTLFGNKKKTARQVGDSARQYSVEKPWRNAFSPQELVAFYFYVTDARLFNFQSPTNDKFPSFVLSPFKYSDWDQKKGKHWEFDIPEHVRNNDSLYGHAFLTRNGAQPQDYFIRPQDVVYRMEMLTKYMPIQSEKKSKRLLGQSAPKNPKDGRDIGQLISHWNPNITVNWIVDTATHSIHSFPPFISQRRSLEIGNYH
jgi:hypothetical protein